MILEERLRTVCFLSSLAEEELAKVAAAGSVIELPAGRLVCQEGDTSTDMYVIIDGHARVSRCDADGTEVGLARLGPGDFFGEFSLLDGSPRSASVTCEDEVRLFTLDRPAFESLLEWRPRALLAMLSAVTQRSRALTRQFFEETLAKNRIKAEAEIERHRSLAQMVAGVAHELN